MFDNSKSCGLLAQYLRCEYLTNPVAVDTPWPRLTWELASARTGDGQTAYRILVASSAQHLAEDTGDLWDSGKVTSDETANIPYAGCALASRVAAHWKVRVWDCDGHPSPWSEPAYWAMGLLADNDWTATWITDGVGDGTRRHPARQLRREFTVTGEIRRAVAYVSALGLYEFRLNGQRVGDQLLAPEWTDYTRRAQYQTFDVTPLLATGANAAAAWLGDGWYCGRIGLAGGQWHANTPEFGIYGPAPKFICQMEIELADGERQTIVSDDEWRLTRDGPITFADLIDGEHYDARREQPGWDCAGFDGAGWEQVKVAEAPGVALVAQPNEPIRFIDDLHPVALTEPQKGVFIFDLGQNMVGWARLALPAGAVRRGEAIRIRHGEALSSDGTLYTANLRGAAQEDRYTCRGEGAEVWEPRFTSHGFRYVELTGLSRPPARDWLTGRVFNSAAPEVGAFECSSPLLNQLMRNILWTQRGNLTGVPTDCPQRDERMGWTGDIQVFCQTACFNMDMAAFLTKFVVDLRDAQDAKGRFPHYAPRPYYGGAGSPGWADAGVIIPWRVYQNYGDTRLLAEHFDAARRWVDYVHGMNPDLIWRNDRGADFGDWLNADTWELAGWPKTGGAVPKEVYSTAFFAHSAELLGKMAGVLGREPERERYEQLASAIKAAFMREFVSEDGRISGDTQAGYALALAFDVLPPELRAKAVARLTEAIAAYRGHLSTGIQATVRLMLELTRADRADLAYDILNLRDLPSWGYAIDQGATTIWERWDGYTPERGYQDPIMNSLNHWALGAVGEWVWRTVAGIHPDDTGPGYRRVLIQPQPGGGVTWVRATYRSIRGAIATEWTASDDAFTLRVTIPPNVTATVRLPDGSFAGEVGAGTHEFHCAPAAPNPEREGALP